MFANVIVNISSSNVDQMFEYLVPTTDMANYIKPGSRVIVPFGQANREVMGYVLEIYENKRYEGKSKEIIELLDLKPIISEKQIRLAFYLKEDTICPLCRILNMMIPTSMKTKTYKYLKIKNFNDIDAAILAYFNGKDSLIYNSKINIPISKIRKEIEKGNLEISYEAKQLTNYYYLNKYYVNKDLLNDVSYLVRNENVKEFLFNFVNKAALTKNEILAEYDLSISQINSLIKKDLLKKTLVRSFRIKTKDIPLKEINIKEIDYLNRIDKKDKPYLIVPESKEEENNLCLNLVKNTLDKGENAVIFTPNILSSIKIATFLRKSFGQSVACLNSLITNAEYFDYYTKILDNEYKIIVTTPMASFLPYQNVGLYFMFNEDDNNYFNDQSPRFDLHKAINYLSINYQTLFVMSSLSPSVNSYCYGLKGIYYLIDNSKENNDIKNTIVDLKTELRKGNNNCLSTYLKERLDEIILNNEQALLIINKKDSNNYVMCRNCGQNFKCPRCMISYNYSEKYNQLVCPACGKREDFNSICPNCGNNKFIFGGFGQESLIKELKGHYESKRILQLSDGKDFDLYLDELNKIEENEVNIIVSSAAIAEGAINKKMKIVSLIDFDSTLKTPSYEANSIAYSLLSLSSSYLDKDGELIVQTNELNNNALKNFVAGSYLDFIKEEIKERKLLRLEPFYHINRIIVKSKNSDIFKDATKVKSIIKELGGNEVFVIGPVYSQIDKGAVITCKHRSNKINSIYHHLYEVYQGSNIMLIFDKYAKTL